MGADHLETRKMGADHLETRSIYTRKRLVGLLRFSPREAA